MAAKRKPGADLNQDNWDQDDEAEEAGTFKQANKDVLKKRAIKTAWRRGTLPENNDSDAKRENAFGGFTAFSKASANPSSAFSFLAKPTASTAPTNTTTPLFNFSNKSNTDTNGSNTNNKKDISPIKTNGNNHADSGNEVYLAKLKGLNESVSKWIKKHVDENPFLNLSPIFKDYEKYFNEIEKSKVIKVSDETNKELSTFSFKSTTTPSKSDVTETPTFKLGSTSNATPAKTDSTPKFSFGAPASTEKKSTETSALSFGKATATPEKSEDKEKPTFSFGSKTDAPAPSSLFSFAAPAKTEPPKISFGTPATTASSNFIFGGPTQTNASTGFSFTSTPFSFGNTAAPKPAETTANQEEEDEPPKNDFTPVVEKDHLYTIRCKVFVKKDGNFGDRGVGNLYLKQVPDSEKVQLIVRADTNLGNLLCNFLLSESIPTQRMGKKDVMLVCIPTPEHKGPPTPILFRVKSAEEADELLKVLDKHKK